MDVYSKVSRTMIMLEAEGEEKEECDEDKREGRDHTQGWEGVLSFRQ